MLAVGGSMAANGATKITQENVPLTSTEFEEQSNGGITLASTNTDTGYADEEDYTLSLWFKITVDQSGVNNEDYDVIMFGKGSRGGFAIMINDETGDDEHVRIRHYTDGMALGTFDDTTNLAHDTWYHLAVTYKYSLDTVKIYIDGALSTTHTSAQAPTQIATPQFVCKGYGLGSTGFDGWLNNFGYWSSHFSDSQILELYNGGNSCDITKIDPDNQKCIYLFDSRDSSGSDNVKDYGPHGAHLTAESSIADSDFEKSETSKNTLVAL